MFFPTGVTLLILYDTVQLIKNLRNILMRSKILIILLTKIFLKTPEFLRLRKRNMIQLKKSSTQFHSKTLINLKYMLLISQGIFLNSTTVLKQEISYFLIFLERRKKKKKIYLKIYISFIIIIMRVI